LSQEGKSKASGEEEDIDDLTDAEDSQKSLKTTFELNDTLYAEAELEDSDTVFLWLGVCLALEHLSNIHVSFYISLKGQRYVIIQNPGRCQPTEF